MARPISLIQSQILDNITANTTLGPLLTSTSKRAIFNLWAFIVAVAINLLEQLIDVFTAAVEAIAATTPALNASWLQAQVMKFQYSETNPQIIQFINFAPSYPVVDTTLCIVSRCSITTDLANNVLIKYATGNPPTAGTSDQTAALQSMVTSCAPPGVTYVVSSTDADEIYIEAEYFYLGQYSDSIEASITDAINNYLASLPFNGILYVSKLYDAMLNAPGITDILLQNVSVRSAATVFGSGTYLVLNNQVVSRIWNTVSGYVIPETTAGQTLAETLEPIPQ